MGEIGPLPRQQYVLNLNIVKCNNYVKNRATIQIWRSMKGYLCFNNCWNVGIASPFNGFIDKLLKL